MSYEVYLVWEKRDVSERILEGYEDLDDAKEAVDSHAEGIDWSMCDMQERGIYSQYGVGNIGFGYWVTKSSVNESSKEGDQV